MCRSIALSMQDRIVVTYNFRHQGEAYVYPSSDRLPSSRSERPVSRSVRPCYAFALQLTCGIPRSKSRCKGIKRASLIERQIVTLNFAEQRAQDCAGKFLQCAPLWGNKTCLSYSFTASGEWVSRYKYLVSTTMFYILHTSSPPQTRQPPHNT